MSEDYAGEEFEKAIAALDDARTMHASGVSDEAIVSRCYYACFHAANAALYDRGHEPNTHRGRSRSSGRNSSWTGRCRGTKADF